MYIWTQRDIYRERGDDGFDCDNSVCMYVDTHICKYVEIPAWQLPVEHSCFVSVKQQQRRLLA